MKQLDIVVSPAAFVRNPYLTLTHVTFDLDPCDLCPRGQISMKLQKIFDIPNLVALTQTVSEIWIIVQYY